MHNITRRRAFRIMAAAAGLPLLIAGVRAAAPKPRFFAWQGEVLGAASELTLWHCDEALGAPRDPEGAARDRAVRERSSASIATARSRASIATACWRGRRPNWSR